VKRKGTSAQNKYHHGDLKKAILNGGLEMVAESGLDNLSLREVARRIGVTTAAPYYHFKDRQSLLIELAIQGYGELFEAVRRAREAASDPENEVSATATAYLRFGREHRALYAIMFSGEFTTHARLQDMVSIANRSLELVRQSIAATGKLSKAQSTAAAFCAWSLVHGILTLNQNGVLGESIEEQERLALAGVIAIIRGMSAGT